MNSLKSIVIFSISGFVGLLFDLLATFILKEVFHANAYLSGALGFFVSMPLVFLMHKNWTYSFKGNTNILQQFKKYFLISLAGIIANFCLVFFIYRNYSDNLYLVKGCATLIVAAWNFIMNKFYTFPEENK